MRAARRGWRQGNGRRREKRRWGARGSTALQRGRSGRTQMFFDSTMITSLPWPICVLSARKKTQGRGRPTQMSKMHEPIAEL